MPRFISTPAAMQKLQLAPPTSAISASAAEHRASNGSKRADISRFWTRAVTGVRFSACTCSTQPQINLKPLIWVAACHMSGYAIEAEEASVKQEMITLRLTL